MQLQPRLLTYVPTISTRASEMRGLEQLPGPTKDKIQPLFLLAPWPNANYLNMTMKKIAGAFPNRPYILDIDRYYRTESETFAAQEFAALKEDTDAYRNWTDFVAAYPNVTPVVQHARLSEHALLKQIRRFQDLKRTFCVRVELGPRLPKNFDAIVGALNAIGTADFFIIIDGGLQTNVLDILPVASGLIDNALSEISANVPIVVSATSMRSSFADIDAKKIDPFNNRALISQIARKHNSRSFVYGDWASTRPRSYDRASPPLPRIDYPLKDAWMFARSKSKNWDFKKAANAIVTSEEWLQCYPMGVWGEELILGAAKGGSRAVNSVQKNISARVNIHLHKQAFYEARDYRSIDLDEPWTDI